MSSNELTHISNRLKKFPVPFTGALVTLSTASELQANNFMCKSSDALSWLTLCDSYTHARSVGKISTASMSRGGLASKRSHRELIIPFFNMNNFVLKVPNLSI